MRVYRFLCFGVINTISIKKMCRVQRGLLKNILVKKKFVVNNN